MGETGYGKCRNLSVNWEFSKKRYQENLLNFSEPLRNVSRIICFVVT
jgi:hypothetical protein